MPLPATTTANDMYTQLVTVLQGVMDPLNGTNPVFENTDNSWNIYDGTVTEYTGTPAAILEPADGPESEFATSAENYRGYGYYVFIRMDTMTATYLTSRQNMRLIIDSVLDALDRSKMLNGTVDILKAATFRWLKENSATGVTLIAPILITAQKTIEVN